MKRIAFLAATISMVASSASATQFPSVFGNQGPLEYLQDCLARNGVAIPGSWCDLGSNGAAIIRPEVVPTPLDKALTVIVSPKSGAPGPYPGSSIPVTAHGTGTTGAVTATLPAIPGYNTFVCGFSVSPGSAATAITLTETLSGILGGSMTWAVGAPVTAVGTTGTTLTQNFNPCIPASASNTAIVITSSALGTSGVNNDAQIWGYQKVINPSGY